MCSGRVIPHVLAGILAFTTVHLISSEETCEPYTFRTSITSCSSSFLSFSDDQGTILPDEKCNFNDELKYYMAKCAGDDNDSIEFLKVQCTDDTCLDCASAQDSSTFVTLLPTNGESFQINACYTGDYNSRIVGSVAFAPSTDDVSSSCVACLSSVAPTTTPMPTTPPTASPMPSQTPQPSTSASPTDFKCNLCPDGTNVISRPDRELPYTNIAGEADTCQVLVGIVEKGFVENEEDCSEYQAYAGYCGCPDVPPTESCQLCPDESKFPNDDTTIVKDEFGERRCADIQDAVSYFSKAFCMKNQDFITADAYRCGCPRAPVPQCPLCQGVNGEETCNLQKCTRKLLDLVPEDQKFDECNYFCSGRWSKSTSFTPRFISQNCLAEDLVWGCNEEHVVSSSSQHGGMYVAWIIAIATLITGTVFSIGL